MTCREFIATTVDQRGFSDKGYLRLMSACVLISSDYSRCPLSQTFVNACGFDRLQLGLVHGAGAMSNSFLITQLAPRKADWLHRMVRTYQ
jgi:hypothetical protein